MKKTITLISLLTLTFAKAQVITADFENFSLPANSYYKDTNSVSFQTTNAIFRYTWTKGAFPYWSAGFAYTNKKDSSNGGSANLYNCIAYNGYANSNYYATGQDGAIIVLKSPNNYVNGFYITNTTYDWKSMKSGDAFAKKFGGPSGNDPDWFKVTIKGYLGGATKPDSSVFYLADYRFANNALDYIVKSWQWVNCSNLGNVDSIKFFMYSSDMSFGFINTPAFFSIDNFTTSQGVGINELSFANNLNAFPNPAHDLFNINLNSNEVFDAQIKICNAIGMEVQNQTAPIQLGNNNIQLNLNSLAEGMYFVELSNKEQKKLFKLIKN